MKGTAATIRFTAIPYVLKGALILRVPEDESVKLSSRGQISVEGSINSHAFTAILEPDGYWSHWLRIDKRLRDAAAIQAGEELDVELTQRSTWPEPTTPRDFAAALAAAPKKVHELWDAITPMARWEWVRWINATNVTETRSRRVEASVSKMNSGKRRPCCFNLAACTDPDLSKGGRLIEQE